MRAKQAPAGGVFIDREMNFFSDVQYNSLVTLLDGVAIEKKGNNNTDARIVFTHGKKDKAVSSAINSLISVMWSQNLDNERGSRDVDKNKLVIKFKTPGTRNNYYDKLIAIQNGGLIASYDTNSPTTAKTVNGLVVKLDTVSNNPAVKPSGITPGDNPLGNSKGSGNGDENNENSGSMSNYIIIGAVVLVVLILLMKKSK